MPASTSTTDDVVVFGEREGGRSSASTTASAAPPLEPLRSKMLGAWRTGGVTRRPRAAKGDSPMGSGGGRGDLWPELRVTWALVRIGVAGEMAKLQRLLLRRRRFLLRRRRLLQQRLEIWQKRRARPFA